MTPDTSPIHRKNSFPLMPVAFCLPFLYWLYLALTTQFIVVHDSAGYEELGRLLNQVNGIEYLECGPHREPLYPMLVAFCMRLADAVGTSYLNILKAAHISSLWITQILMLIFLKKLRVGPFLSALTILYFGFSPSIIHSAFSFYSEIIVYPCVLVMILLLVRSWQNLGQESRTEKIILSGIFLGCTLIATTFVKGIFELIAPLCLLPFIISLGKAIAQKRNKSATTHVVFLISTILAFYIPITGYKLLNKHLNGRFTITDRGPWALYGSTARRMEPLTQQRLLTALGRVPGKDFCDRIFTEESCEFWSTDISDATAHAAMQDLKRRNIIGEKMDQRLIELTFKEALSDPPQYILLAVIEALKFFFWESAEVGLTAYPDWIEKIYQHPWMDTGLKFLMAGLTFLIVGWLVVYLWHQKNILWKSQTEGSEEIAVLFWIFTVILACMMIFSCFAIVARWILFLVPLYLILLARGIQRLSYWYLRPLCSSHPPDRLPSGS